MYDLFTLTDPYPYQTVTDVIEKQKKQISTKLRQHSPSRSDRGDSPTKRTLIRSHSSRSDISLSPDSSRIISVTSSDRELSEKQVEESVSESMEKSTRSISESVEQERRTGATTHSVSSRKQDDTSNSISEDLSKFSEASYHKLLPSAAEIEPGVHLSLPELASNESVEKPAFESIKSVEELRPEGDSDSDKPTIYSLQEVGDIVEDDKAPYHESPQPSFHLDVKEVLEDLSISSGSSINDNTDVSISSYKHLPPSRLSQIKDDSISEEISEEATSGKSSDRSVSQHQNQSAKTDHTYSRSDSSSHHKTISEKLAGLNLDGGVLSPTLNKLTSKSSLKNSYTLSFDEVEDDNEEIKSLLSNIDESLSKSADVMSAAKSSSPGMVNVELDVEALTPVAGIYLFRCSV